MNHIKMIISFLIIISISYGVYAANIVNRPTEVRQPDGTVINAFVSGNAYHRRFHDKDGYTMTREHDTDLICWARQGEDGLLESTGFAVHLYDPKTLGLEPNVDISQVRYRELRNWIDSVIQEGKQEF